MIFKIPQDNRKFEVSNATPRLGNIRRTKSVTLRDRGYMTLERRIRSFASDVQMTDFSNSQGLGAFAFVFDSGLDNILALGTKNVYKSTYANPTSFSKDTDTGFPTLDATGENDTVDFGDDIYVAHGGTLTKKAGTTWSAVSSVASPVTLCNFYNLKQLACGGGSTVELIDTADNVVTTLTLPDQFEVTKMAWNNHLLYIATRNRVDGQGAMLFVWDGLSSSANAGYPVTAHTIYSVVPYGTGCACVTSDAELLYNSGGWKVLDRFPLYYLREQFDDVSSQEVTSRAISPNAMESDGDYIYVGIRGTMDTDGDRNTPRFYQENPLGLWCYDPEAGLHHCGTVDGALASPTSAIATTDVNTTTNVITVAGATVPPTGTPCFYYNALSTASLPESSSATPLRNGTRYWVINQSSTTLKLAATKADAEAGTAIDLTGTGNNDQYILFTPNDQLGGIRGGVTAIKLWNHRVADDRAPSTASRLLIGGIGYDDDNAAVTYLATMAADNLNWGYVVFSRMESEQVEDDFQHLVLKFRPLTYPEERIIVKFRTRDCTIPDYETTNDGDATDYEWTDGNTFTTTVDLSSVKTRADAGIYDEVEITRGKGAGYCAMITSITENAGTYTVNIDETIPDVTSGDNLSVVFSNWTKVDEFDYTSPTNDSGFLETMLGANAQFIDVKIDFVGYDVRAAELQVATQTVKGVQVYN